MEHDLDPFPDAHTMTIFLRTLKKATHPKLSTGAKGTLTEEKVALGDDVTIAEAASEATAIAIEAARLKTASELRFSMQKVKRPFIIRALREKFQLPQYKRSMR